VQTCCVTNGSTSARAGPGLVSDFRLVGGDCYRHPAAGKFGQESSTRGSDGSAVKAAGDRVYRCGQKTSCWVARVADCSLRSRGSQQLRRGPVFQLHSPDNRNAPGQEHAGHPAESRFAANGAGFAFSPSSCGRTVCIAPDRAQTYCGCFRRGAASKKA